MSQSKRPTFLSVFPSSAVLGLLLTNLPVCPAEAQGDDSLFVTANGIGIGTELPAATLHVTNDDGSTQVKVQEGSAVAADRTLLNLENNGPTRMQLENTNNVFGNSWSFFHLNNGGFAITRDGSGMQELFVSHDGDVTIVGDVTANGVVLDSSKALKTAFEPANTSLVLERLLSLPISEWRFRGDKAEARHLGPFAEDFYAAFNLGASSDHLNVTDTMGVALAAIQGLHQKVLERDERIRELEGALERLTSKVETLAQAQTEIR